MSDDPYALTEQKADALYSEIHRVLAPLQTEAWPALQAKASELNREVNGATYRLPKFREDVTELRTDRAAAAAAFEADYRETKAKVDKLHKDIEATLDILRAEVVVQARPKIDPSREQFVRDDLKDMLSSSSDPLKLMNDIAAGAHRDRAALIVGDFADAYLQRHLPDKRTREQFRDGLGAAAIEGSLKHGTESERVAARAAKDVLPKTAGWVAARITPAMARLKDAESRRP
jgi:hypothetical protein